MLIPALILSLTIGLIPVQDKKDKTESDKKKAAAAKQEQQRLQGTWQVVEFVTSGEPLPEETTKIMRVVFKGNQMVMSLPKDAGKREYTFTLDPTQKPKEIDTILQPGKFKIKITRATPGIYQLDGNTLKLCLARFGGKLRPTEFESTAASGTILITLKRATR